MSSNFSQSTAGVRTMSFAHLKKKIKEASLVSLQKHKCGSMERNIHSVQMVTFRGDALFLGLFNYTVHLQIAHKVSSWWMHQGLCILLWSHKSQFVCNFICTALQQLLKPVLKVLLLTTFLCYSDCLNELSEWDENALTFLTKRGKKRNKLNIYIEWTTSENCSE